MPTLETDDEAMMWMIRTRDPAFSDWSGLTAWLEAAPANNQRYEAALALHDAAGDVTPLADAAADAGSMPAETAAKRRTWLAWSGTGLAAGIALAVGIHGSNPPAAGMVVRTEPGEQRMVRLPDGTQIALNGDSRLVRTAHQNRRVTLDHGEASFTVAHDAARPFEVVVAGAVVRDLGTRFDLVRDRDEVRLSVAEGAVLYTRADAAIRLTAGRALTERSGVIRLGWVDVASVGGWGHGRLTYRDARLAEVAGDLSRGTGTAVTVASDLADRRFSGTIMLDKEPSKRLMRRVAALLGLRAQCGRDGCRFSRADGSSP